MRIWWQSSMSLDVDPLWKPYQESLKRHIQEVARQGTTVDVHGVKFVEPLLERSNYVRYLNEAQVINNAITAEREGYDAFCVGCTLDPGLPEIKEVVSIPVVFLSESCMHLACILGGKFSLLAFNKHVLLHLTCKVRQYGLEEHLIPSEPFNLSVVDLPNGFENPDPIIHAIRQAGMEAIAQGTGMFISACNILNMVLIDCGCRQIDGVPILDTAGALVKITELMVDLEQIGITRSKVGLYTSLSKEELARIRKSYGVE
ncbi:aspartate/glutamate racemase family protein [Chloroflexota bacterium]